MTRNPVTRPVEAAATKEESPEETALSVVPDVNASPVVVKNEGGSASEVVAPVVFKKRKVKK